MWNHLLSACARFAVMANRAILTGRGEEGGNDVRVVKEMEGAGGKRKPAGSLKNGNRCLLALFSPPGLDCWRCRRCPIETSNVPVTTRPQRLMLPVSTLSISHCPTNSICPALNINTFPVSECKTSCRAVDSAPLLSYLLSAPTPQPPTSQFTVQNRGAVNKHRK